MLEIESGALLHRCGRDSERQRMTTGKSVYRPALPLGNIDALQQLLCIGIGQRHYSNSQKQVRPAGRFLPTGHRWLAADQDDSDVVRQRGDEDLAHPRLEKAQDFTVVEGQHDARIKMSQPLGRLTCDCGFAADGSA